MDYGMQYCLWAVARQASKIFDYTSSGVKPVEIVSENRVKDLEFIGYVQGTSLLTGMFRQSGYNNALNQMLKNAATMGAKYVVLDLGSGAKYWTTEQVVRGKAYR